MARKPKTVVASSAVEQAEVVEVKVVTQPIVSEAVEQTVAEEVVEQTGPSLVSQFISEVQAPSTEVEAPKAKTEKNEGVGQFIRKLIGEGLGNKEILAIVHEQYGNKNTTYACVAWYRNKMNKAGKDVKKASNVEWLQNFAKTNGLSEEAVVELAAKVA
jgi:hypothetical protein